MHCDVNSTAKMNYLIEAADELALPPVKIHCSILAEDAIKAAISDYKNKAKVDGVSCC